jgi:hypothetical protein
MAEAGALDLTILAGSTYHKVLTWSVDGVPVDLSGYTAVLQVRSTEPSADLLLELTTSGDPAIKAITLGGALGTITLDMSATETRALTFSSGAYQLEVTSPLREVTRVIEGTLTVSPGVIR